MESRTKALMIQGTGSGVGKSAIVAGLCRILKDLGVKVAPFKAQNMALNSFITREGGEIGRAQALQAEAAGIEPRNDINPVLLKASGEAGCQVVLNGKVHSNMKAKEYYAFRDEAWKAVTSAYERLSKEYDVIVIEGAGSPAEINLQKQEIVNMAVARYTNSPVILVGDIDHGGVFASFYGTVELLKDSSNRSIGLNGLNSLNNSKCDADYIKAFIVNKFRGDMEILRPGLRMIEDKTGRPVIGVLPHIKDIGLHEEDGLILERFKQFKPFEPFKQIKIVVVKLQYISNFTDFDPFFYEPDMELLYSRNHADIENADIVIIPGSKNTVKDLLFLKETGLDESIKMACAKGGSIIGVCGGYQMLGQKISDPFGVESSHKEVDGLGLLDIETTLEKTKVTSQVEAEIISEKWEVGSEKLKGYEIHMGNTTGDIGLFKIKRLYHINSSLVTRHSSLILDGSTEGNVWGTYIHGIFDNDDFRNAMLNSIRQRKGLPHRETPVDYHSYREDAINKWAGILKNSVDICFILRLLGMEHCIGKF
ncbi:MAG: cobyric acid synthase [Nitrospirae bacterium]|nr:cobyric acid synthase [Nitrospirota bacterium]